MQCNINILEGYLLDSISKSEWCRLLITKEIFVQLNALINPIYVATDPTATIRGEDAGLSVRKAAGGGRGSGGRGRGGGCGGSDRCLPRAGGGGGVRRVANTLVGDLGAGVLAAVQPAGDHTGRTTGIACNQKCK